MDLRRNIFEVFLSRTTDTSSMPVEIEALLSISSPTRTDLLDSTSEENKQEEEQSLFERQFRARDISWWHHEQDEQNLQSQSAIRSVHIIDAPVWRQSSLQHTVDSSESPDVRRSICRWNVSDMFRSNNDAHSWTDVSTADSQHCSGEIHPSSTSVSYAINKFDGDEMPRKFQYRRATAKVSELSVSLLLIVFSFTVIAHRWIRAKQCISKRIPMVRAQPCSLRRFVRPWEPVFSRIHSDHRDPFVALSPSSRKPIPSSLSTICPSYYRSIRNSLMIINWISLTLLRCVKWTDNWRRTWLKRN